MIYKNPAGYKYILIFKVFFFNFTKIFYLFFDVYNSFIHHHQNLDATKMSF